MNDRDQRYGDRASYFQAFDLENSADFGTHLRADSDSISDTNRRNRGETAPQREKKTPTPPTPPAA